MASSNLVLLGGIGIATYLMSEQLTGAIKKASKGGSSGGGTTNIFKIGGISPLSNLQNPFQKTATTNGNKWASQFQDKISTQQNILTGQAKAYQDKIKQLQEQAKNAPSNLKKDINTKIKNFKTASLSEEAGSWLGSGFINTAEGVGIGLAYGIGDALGFNKKYNISLNTFSSLVKRKFGGSGSISVNAPKGIYTGGTTGKAVAPSNAYSFVSTATTKPLFSLSSNNSNSYSTKIHKSNGGYHGTNYVQRARQVSRRSGLLINASQQKQADEINRSSGSYFKKLKYNPNAGTINKVPTPSFWSNPIGFIGGWF